MVELETNLSFRGMSVIFVFIELDSSPHILKCILLGKNPSKNGHEEQCLSRMKVVN